MVRLALAALTLLVTFPFHAAAQDPRPPGESSGAAVDPLAWMTGCWEGTLSSGASYEETWMAPRGGMMLGTARMIRGGRVVSWEFMQIGADGQGLLYVARPSGQSPTGFRAVGLDGTSVTFENLEHDFPQRIVYRFTPPDRLDARIEGEQAGEIRGLDFPLRKVGCEIHRDAVVIGLLAPHETVMALRDELGEEDFHVVADDLMWYRAQAFDALEELPVPVVYLEGRQTLRFQVEGEIRGYDFPDLPTLDLVVLYQPPHAPVAVPPIGLPEELARAAARGWFSPGIR